MIIKKQLKEGQRVKIIRPIEDYPGSAQFHVRDFPDSWEGIIIGIGITNDGFYHAYDLLGNDGVILKNCPAPALFPVPDGIKRDIVKIINRITVSFENEVEREEFIAGRNYVDMAFEDQDAALVLYHLGKMAGIKKERERRKKKSLKTTLAR